MTAYGPTELATAFRTVRKNTVQVAEDIPEDKYDFAGAPGTATVSETLRHLIYSPMLHEDIHRVNRATTLVGYDFGKVFGGMKAKEAEKRSKSEIIAQLESEGERFAAWLESLTPEFLAERVGSPTGQGSSSRLEGLLSPKEHEMHHRAQLMLIERMLGITPHLTRQREERQRQQQKS